MSLDIRVAMGRRWLKLIGGIEAGLAQKFIDALGFAAPDPSLHDDAAVAAHRESWQTAAAFAGRAMDGRALFEHLVAPGIMPTSLSRSPIPANAAGRSRTRRQEFLRWYGALFYEPRDGSGSAWLPGAPGICLRDLGAAERRRKASDGRRVLSGPSRLVQSRHRPGRRGPRRLSTARPTPRRRRQTRTASFIPVPIQFDGMPNTRWWTFEEGRTNFGDIDPDTTDVNKLLLMEFALVYANDWFLLPFTLPAGTIARIAGMTVTNVFGERIWVEAAGRGVDQDWQRWSMFTLATKGRDDIPADLSLVLVPSVAEDPGERAARGSAAHSRRDGQHGLGHRDAHRAADRREQVGPQRRARHAALSSPAGDEACRPVRRRAADRERGGDPLPADDRRCRRTGSRSSRCISRTTSARSSCAARRCCA